jgi:hypothetical protein
MAETVSSVALFAFVILPVAVSALAWGLVLGIERYSGAKPGVADAEPPRRLFHANRPAMRGRR